ETKPVAQSRFVRSAGNRGAAVVARAQLVVCRRSVGLLPRTVFAKGDPGRRLLSRLERMGQSMSLFPYRRPLVRRMASADFGRGGCAGPHAQAGALAACAPAAAAGFLPLEYAFVRRKSGLCPCPLAQQLLQY